MTDSKDKVIGEVKEAVGKVTGNEELELKGKIQSSKPDLRDKAHEIKEGISGNSFFISVSLAPST